MFHYSHNLSHSLTQSLSLTQANGLRIYYEGRSQPPMLTLMIKEYLDSSSSNNNQHISFLKRAMPILEKEYSWWMSERQVSVNGFNSLNRYNAPSHTQPRPESYIEDVETGQMAKKLNTITNILQVFSDLAASAESGWDFSSRFTMNPIQVSSCNNNITATSHANLARIKTSNVIPVDLNALMFMNEEIMASLFLRIGDSVKSKIFSSLAISRKEAILSLMWDSEAGQFYDFILSRNTTSGLFTPASFWPIW